MTLKSIHDVVNSSFCRLYNLVMQFYFVFSKEYKGCSFPGSPNECSIYVQALWRVSFRYVHHGSEALLFRCRSIVQMLKSREHKHMH